MSEGTLFFEIEDYPRRLVRKDPGGVVAEMVDGEWRLAPWRKSAQKSGAIPQPEKVVGLRCRQRLTCVALDAPTKAWVGRRSVHPGPRVNAVAGRALRGVAMWVLPPLPYGAPFRFDGHVYCKAQAAFEEELRDPKDGEAVDPVAIIERATDGHRSQEMWLQNIEARASAFGSYASAVAGLVAVGAAILSGRDSPLPHHLLVSAMWCLVVSGFRGWQASYKRIDRVRPHDSSRLASKRYVSASDRQRAELAALLVAEHRGSVLEDWKLDRLKQSSRFFALALIALLAVGLLLILASAS
jgi:hypothetical protein